MSEAKCEKCGGELGPRMGLIAKCGKCGGLHVGKGGPRPPRQALGRGLGALLGVGSAAERLAGVERERAAARALAPEDTAEARAQAVHDEDLLWLHATGRRGSMVFSARAALLRVLDRLRVARIAAEADRGGGPLTIGGVPAEEVGRAAARATDALDKADGPPDGLARWLAWWDGENDFEADPPPLDLDELSIWLRDGEEIGEIPTLALLDLIKGARAEAEELRRERNALFVGLWRVAGAVGWESGAKMPRPEEVAEAVAELRAALESAVAREAALLERLARVLEGDTGFVGGKISEAIGGASTDAQALLQEHAEGLEAVRCLAEAKRETAKAKAAELAAEDELEARRSRSRRRLVKLWKALGGSGPTETWGEVFRLAGEAGRELVSARAAEEELKASLALRVREFDALRAEADVLRERLVASEAARKAPAGAVRCPDGGKCNHGCKGSGPCWRVGACGPLSGVFEGDRWPAEVEEKHAPGRVIGRLREELAEARAELAGACSDLAEAREDLAEARERERAPGPVLVVEGELTDEEVKTIGKEVDRSMTASALVISDRVAALMAAGRARLVDVSSGRPSARDLELHAALLRAGTWHMIGGAHEEAEHAFRVISEASLLELAAAAERVDRQEPEREERADGSTVTKLRAKVADRLVAACYVAATYQPDGSPVVAMPDPATPGVARAVVVAPARYTEGEEG